MIATRVVYYDYGGSHTSVVAANIHVGKLEPNRVPTNQELMKLPFFDKTTQEDFGKLHYVGNDEKGNQVYVLGTKNSDYGRVLTALTQLMGAGERFTFNGTMPYVNWTLRIGGWTSRSLSLPALGRPLVFAGIRKGYGKLVRMVDRQKAVLHLTGDRI